MKFIKSYVEYIREDNWPLLNVTNKLAATSFVDANILRLLPGVKDDVDDDEKRKILIEYFTRYPDEIKSVSFKSFGSPRNYVPALMNIGGTGEIKYL